MKTARAIVMAVCAMFLLGAFATASPLQAARSDLMQARDLLSNFDPKDPDVKRVNGAVSYAFNQLNGATNRVGDNREVATRPVRGRDRLDSVALLLNRAHDALRNARLRDPQAQTMTDDADRQLVEALKTIDHMRGSGRYATAQYGGRDDRRRDWGRGYDRRGSPLQAARSDLMQARDLLSRFDPQDPDVKKVNGAVNYAFNHLNGVTNMVGDTREVRTPPVRGRDRLDSVATLLERAHDALREVRLRDSRAQTMTDEAAQQLEEALRTIEDMRRGGRRW